MKKVNWAILKNWHFQFLDYTKDHKDKKECQYYHSMFLYIKLYKYIKNYILALFTKSTLFRKGGHLLCAQAGLSLYLYNRLSFPILNGEDKFNVLGMERQRESERPVCMWEGLTPSEHIRDLLRENSYWDELVQLVRY